MAADLRLALVDDDLIAARRGDAGVFETGRAGADHQRHASATATLRIELAPHSRSRPTTGL